MGEAIADYLGRLGRNEIATVEYLSPLLRGTIRLDIEHDTGIDHWFVTLDKGKVRVSREGRAADAVICGRQELFDRLVRGEAQIMASLFRNEISVEGDLKLLERLGRLFPGPQGAHDPREFARTGGRKS